jgi:hypothetical protein
MVPAHVAEALRVLMTHHVGAAEAAIRVLRGDGERSATARRAEEARSAREQRRALAERIEARRRELYRPVEEANDRVRRAKELPAIIEAEMYADQRACLPDGRPDDARRSRGWDHVPLNVAKAEIIALRKEAGKALAKYRIEVAKLATDPLAVLDATPASPEDEPAE